jgi:hypothetical protein
VIPDGSIITYQGVWPGGVLANITGGNATDRVVAVGNALNDVGLAVRHSDYQPDFLGGIPDTGLPISLSLQVENGLGFGQADDIITVIRHAVLQVFGDYPISDTIPLVQVPGGTQTPTGQPVSTPGQAGAPGTAGCIAGTSNDLAGTFSLGCWFSNLTTKGLSTVGLLAVFVVLGVALVIFIPHKVSG